MYWFKLKHPGAIGLVCVFALPVLFSACKPEIKNNGAFNLKEYFAGEIAILKKQNLHVFKTVTHDAITKTKAVNHNAVTESKTVHIADWAQELSLFTDADINKPAWKNSYKVIDEGGLLIYRAKEKDLKVRELIIKRDKQKVDYILIYNKTDNLLYTTTQKLTYFPDSLYQIETMQHVKLMGSNFYRITGVIKK